jgi:hypothetical protein
MNEGQRLVLLALLAAAVILLAIGIAQLLHGCDSPPLQLEPRETPVAVWCFEDGKALADSTGFDYLLPDANYELGYEITIPARWHVFQFRVFPQDSSVQYQLQWAAPDSTYKPLATAVVESKASGVLWFAADGVQYNDKVRLVRL